MNDLLEKKSLPRFADGQSGRELRSDDGLADWGERTEPHGSADGGATADAGQPFRNDTHSRFEPRTDLGADRPRGGGTDGAPPRSRRIRRRLLLAVPIVIAIAAIAPFAFNYLGSYQATDDAQIDGHIDPLSARINGTVTRVYVEDDDRVKAGQLLVAIDPRDYVVAVDRAQAGVELAAAQIASARQDYAAALANVGQDEAADFKAQRDDRRYAILLSQEVVPQEQYDQIVATARVDAAKVKYDREAAGAAFKTIAAREADAEAARAALAQAELNLSYTRIDAPANGIVGKRAVQLGSRIEPGETLMFVTETDAIWVTANFKETQLARMQPGQRATVHVDTFGRDFREHIANMPGASGDRFSLLPAENATGNYVKVVQRLPVRIVLEPGQDPGHLLHPGMSVESTVWLR